MTVARVLRDAANQLESCGIDDARLEAEVMLADAMRIDRAHLLARLRDGAPEDALGRFEAMLERRMAREPLAYILGQREFYGIEIACARGALIPRQETELLVELALDEVAAREGDVRVADVGTGSGCIAVAIALSAMNARVTAIDASVDALAVARRNVARYELEERVTLAEGDLLADAGTFDVIVANLPYVGEAEFASLAPEIREHEPRQALVAGDGGTEVIECLLNMAPAHLAPGGLLAAEVGDAQAARLVAAAERCFSGATWRIEKDLAARERVLVARKRVGG